MTSSSTGANSFDNFFTDLPKITQERLVFDARSYAPAPDAWYLINTDVRDSTGAVAAGMHKTVNFVAACSIAAIKNACAPLPIPFLFGGDGASMMVPGRFGDEARRVLARLRRFIKQEYSLDLRVGCAQVGAIRQGGADILVGRYEPTPGNYFGVFKGGGVRDRKSVV